MIIYNIQEIKINQKYIFDIIKKNKVLKEKCIRIQIKFVYIK